MDEHSVSAQLEKLRAEVALIRHQEQLYRHMKCHPVLEKRAHDKRERRLIEIKDELQQLYKRAKPTH